MRQTAEVNWEDKMKVKLVVIMRDIMKEVGQEDPVKGKCHGPNLTSEVIWYSVSSVVTGVILKMG